MKQRTFRAMLAVFLVLCMLAAPVCAAESRDMRYPEEISQRLKQLGLFQGVSETDFALERAPSRLEALVMLIRVLGKEREALDGAWTHPFLDVPAWADSYVGYAYENGLTNGVSATAFGMQPAGAETYLTFMLRALGYSDADGQDFTWDNPDTLARRIGILPECVDQEHFWRADAAMISYAALPVSLKDSDQTLAEKLIEAGCFARQTYDAVYDAALLASPEQETAPAVTAPEPEQRAPLVDSVNFHGKYYTGGSGSKCYHYEAECAGKYSHEITEEEARRLKPCGTCVLH